MARSQIFIGRLPLDVKEKDIELVFEKYGRLIRCDVKYGAGMAYAFVDYEDLRDAADAIKFENGTNISGSTIVVEWAKGPASRQNSYHNRTECYVCHRTGHRARDCWSARNNNWRRNDNRGSNRGGGHYRRRSYSRSRSGSRERRRLKERSYSRSRSPSVKRERSKVRKTRSRSLSRSASPSVHEDTRRSRTPREDRTTPIEAEIANGDNQD